MPLTDHTEVSRGLMQHMYHFAAARLQDAPCLILQEKRATCPFNGAHITRYCCLCMQVSEEIDEEIIIEGGGDYSVMFDPLDGSSNIDCGVSIGTIYGIFKKPADEAASVKNVLRVCSPFQSPDTIVYVAFIFAIKRSFW